MAAPKEILELVERFDRHIEAYKSGKYNETQLRREFIDPFFEALGWDINNRQGHAEAYKDVVHEDSIKVAGGTKAPDYCFRIGGQRKFFVEAKKPSVNVKKEVSPAYQVKRYAWSAKLPLSILTDFEEFSVYDCRTRPLKSEKAEKARVIYFTYKDYLEKWDELAAIFSREAILTGTFDKYIKSTGKKRGTAEVDDAFLKEIESWRMMLAKNLAQRNKKITRRELNFAVQRTIDRLIFLRICEDRGIEPYGQLMALQNGRHAYERLADLFRKADQKYNSGLFHFNEERGRDGQPDNLSLKLKIDDEIIKKILKNLYYPDSPYEFSVLPADILGQVYEQFLGKVIRLTSSHKAVIEEKPEVRKAGGVYYTPTYIVDYIVKNTVGKLVEGKTPKRAEKLRILDPACGSGSFLIGAYQYLIDWHRNWYENDGAHKWATKKTPVLFRDTKGEWKLTTAEKKRILLNNIYGVDIDSQAVEVTKLSLLLKVLEGETEQTINSTLSLFHERALPDLGSNIKCGNSLIGPDFYENQQMSILDEEERYRVNVFDWQAEFSNIMKFGGFDAVIGNPPYINAIQLSKIFGKETKDYWKKRYFSAKGAFDIYVIFFEQSLNVCKPNGFVSFITPNKYISSPYGIALRTLISEKYKLVRIADFSSVDVFDAPSVYPMITILQNNKQSTIYSISIEKFNEKGLESNKLISSTNLSLLPDHIWGILLSTKSEIIEKIFNKTKLLEQVAVVQATSTAAESDEYSKYISPSNKPSNGFPLINTGTIDRYCTTYGQTKFTNKGKKIERPVLAKNKIGKERLLLYSSPKIVIAKLALRLEAFFDEKGEYASINTNCIHSSKKGVPLKFLAGVINSKLMSFIYAEIFSGLRMGGGYFQYQAPQLRVLPIIPANKDTQKELGSLVDSIANLNAKFANTNLPHDKENAMRQIDAIDKQIDQLVYELYGLSEEDVRIIEEDKKK